MKCVNKYFIVIKCENINTNKTQQGYGTRSYFKLMLNRLNTIKGFTFTYTPLEMQFIKVFVGVFICPLTKKPF